MCSVHDAVVINNIHSFWHGSIYYKYSAWRNGRKIIIFFVKTKINEIKKIIFLEGKLIKLGLNGSDFVFKTFECEEF